jgi:hypothetical protein
MLRHDKSTARLLPPIFEVVKLAMSEEEKQSYNAIVSFAKVNLVLTAMEGSVKGSGWELSLLHPKNRKQAAVMMTNIRITCVGGGKQVMTITPQNKQDTLSLLRVSVHVAPSPPTPP